MSNLPRIRRFYGLLYSFIGIMSFASSAVAQMDGVQKELSKDVRQGASFWIGELGPHGPVFTGPQQYPFICTTFENGLGQPVIDNWLGIGNAVFPEIDGQPNFQADPIGYSQYCGVRTRVDYVYYSTAAGRFLPLANPAEVPTDVEKIDRDGRIVNFVVRLERGTINRFIYSIAMLAPYGERLSSPRSLNNAEWNRKLVYKFEGGVGIGHYQGYASMGTGAALHYASLKRGYAIAYSTGTETSTHYNLRLAEETAWMLKAHFQATYGVPVYTVGIGGSGGAIQQYIIAQNNKHIIDAAIPQRSYPDMITQTIHVADCEPLERFFDMEYMMDHQSRWSDWVARGMVEGLPTSRTAIVNPWSASPYAPFPGSSDCISGWRGMAPLVVNPKWTDSLYYQALALYRYPPDVIANIKWTHWNDLGNIYPQDANGNAPNSVDNVGVQYGLRPLVAGAMTTREFLDLNACVGGWKAPQDMVLGGFPWDPTAHPATFDPWDKSNMNLSTTCKFGGPPAPRTEGNIEAMNIAYTSGHVFRGKLKIPVIDLRDYLDPILDMHFSQASFATRARMLKAQGHADNQLIWFIRCKLDTINLGQQCALDPTGRALDVIDQWLANARGHSADQVVKFKPVDAVDTCFDISGNILYSGNDAWDGVINSRPQGACTAAFTISSTSRIQAGEDPTGSIFKCALKPVDVALQDGTYGGVRFQEVEKNQLKAVFASGVCDYELGDVGRPRFVH